MLISEHEDIGTLGSRFDRRINRRHTDGEILHLNQFLAQIQMSAVSIERLGSTRHNNNNNNHHHHNNKQLTSKQEFRIVGMKDAI